MSTIQPHEPVHSGLAHLQDWMKDQILLRLKLLKITDERFAEVMDLLPIGVDVVRHRPWSLAYAFEVAYKFGIVEYLLPEYSIVE